MDSKCDKSEDASIVLSRYSKNQEGNSNIDLSRSFPQEPSNERDNEKDTHRHSIGRRLMGCLCIGSTNDTRVHSMSQRMNEVNDLKLDKVTPSTAWSWEGKVDHDNSYQYVMEKKPRGYCLLINNVDFDESSGYEVRRGSDADAKRLSNTFEGLGFEIIYKHNLSANQMKKMAKHVSKKKKHLEMDAFVMIILSHGDKDIIYGCDAQEVKIFDDLIKPFNNKYCHYLVGKPKMFFFQACRGDKRDFGVTIPKDLPRSFPGHENVKLISEASGDENIHALVDIEGMELFGRSPTLSQMSDAVPDARAFNVIPNSNTSPLGPNVYHVSNNIIASEEDKEFMKTSKIAEWTDIIISYPTVFGYVAMRNPNLGSWYCTALDYALTHHAHHWRLIDILTLVDTKVQEMESNKGDKQATTVQLMAWKKLYFNPGLFKET